jgi:hypothetical protein
MIVKGGFLGGGTTEWEGGKERVMMMNIAEICNIYV